MADDRSFTPTEQRLMDVLGDGLGHTMGEMMTCLWDELAGPKTVTAHLVNIRRKLRAKNQEIISRAVKGTYYYTHVRLMPYSAQE